MVALLRTAIRCGAAVPPAKAAVRAQHSAASAFALGLVGGAGKKKHVSPQNPFEVQSGCLLPGLPASEFQRRREKLFEVLPNNSAIIINAAETKYMTHDIPYEFRQNSNFLYLTGLEEPDAHAVLLKTQDKCSFILFTRPRDAHSEQWDGARIGLNGAIERYHADDAYQLTDLQPALHKILSGLDQVFVMSPEGGKYQATFLDATRSFHDKFFAGNFFVEQLRVVKSEYELDRMRYAADIGVGGFLEMMKNTRAGMTELALASYFEASCKRNGALWNSFPNVVGSGANAAVIHYLSKRNLLYNDELVLVDSGCEVAGGYVSDITRTWPVGGTLSKAQRDLYEFTLEIQKQCLAHLRHQIASKQPISLDQLHDFSVKLMIDGMQEFGILKRNAVSKGFNRSVMAEFQKYNPTHIGHYLGMDVHDTPHITRSAALQPGMVITVEPGIYLPKNDQSIPEEFRGIGIRIEDDVIITESGIEIITKELPKELDAMEALRTA
ncbi:Xaa-pro aminopeptidase, partial [Globisporangium splendens]